MLLVTKSLMINGILIVLCLDDIDARERAAMSFKWTRRDRDIPTGTTLTTKTHSGANAPSNGSSSSSYCNESNSSIHCQTVP